MTIPLSIEDLYHESKSDTADQLKITRQLVLLHTASCNISATLDSRQVAHLILQEFSTLLSAPACFLGIFNEEATTLRVEMVAGYPNEQSNGSENAPASILRTQPGLIKKILSRRNVLHITQSTPGMDGNAKKILQKYGLTSLLVLPLIIQNNPIGFVEIHNRSEKPFETQEIIIARLLANQAVISFENAKLYQSAQQELLARQKTEEQLKYTAMHDLLTNLPNRVLFLDRLEQAMHRYKRYKDLEYAVLFVDLDRFKRINDSYGHIEGDLALQEVANRLLSSVRESDTVSRFGGDEFLVLLEGKLSSTTIKEVTDRIQSNLMLPLSVGDHEFHLSASIGIAYCSPSEKEAHEYIRNANIAMYQAKAKGGGRTEIFTQTRELQIRSKTILESAILEAVKQKSFHFNFQPIYNLETLSIMGLEVLLRWVRDEIAIPPSTFIPLLEDLGVMPDVGIWILRTALNNYQTWIKYNPGVSQLTISINISNSQLIQDDFIDQITRILEETRMDPGKLVLEITELVFIDDLNLAREKIRALTRLGIHVHLDDFGTGYSSLSYLSDLPVQALKIDRKFVQQIDPDSLDQGLVSAILSMARRFKVTVIAEGIETKNQLSGLRFAECEYGQGNFLSPALSEERLLALLRTSPFSSR